MLTRFGVALQNTNTDLKSTDQLVLKAWFVFSTSCFVLSSATSNPISIHLVMPVTSIFKLSVAMRIFITFSTFSTKKSFYISCPQLSFLFLLIIIVFLFFCHVLELCQQPHRNRSLQHPTTRIFASRLRRNSRSNLQYLHNRK